MAKSLEERMEDLGDRLSEDVERFESGVRSRYKSPFGLAGPFLWSLVGLIILGVLIWILNWLGGRIPAPAFTTVADFILDHIGIFFLLLLLFNYFSYLSKLSPRKSRYISPVFKSLSLTIWIWIIARLILLMEPDIYLIDRSISFIIENLLTIFVLLMILFYLVLMTNEDMRSEGDFETMDDGDERWKEGQNIKRLYRSGRDKLLGGVCGGIGEYFNIDPVIVRIIAVIIAIASLGTAILLYLILWVLIPRNPYHRW